MTGGRPRREDHRRTTAANSVVIVATERAYLRILEFIKRLDVPQIAERASIHVLPLQHADAVELTKTLERDHHRRRAGRRPAPGGGAPRPGGAAPLGIFEARVKVSADKATNSIVVTSSLRDYAQLRGVVDRLDSRAARSSSRRSSSTSRSTARTSSASSFHAARHDRRPRNGDGLLYGGLNPF